MIQRTKNSKTKKNRKHMQKHVFENRASGLYYSYMLKNSFKRLTLVTHKPNGFSIQKRGKICYHKLQPSNHLSNHLCVISIPSLGFFFSPFFMFNKRNIQISATCTLQLDVVTNDSETCLFPFANNVVNYTNLRNIYSLLIYFMFSY